MLTDTWWTNRLTTATTISIRFIGSLIWIKATAQVDGDGSEAIWLGPYFCCRLATSAELSPRPASTPRVAMTASGSWAYQATSSDRASALAVPVGVTVMSRLSVLLIALPADSPTNRGATQRNGYR